MPEAPVRVATILKIRNRPEGKFRGYILRFFVDFNLGIDSIGKPGFLYLDISKESGKHEVQPQNNFHFKETHILFHHMDGVIDPSFDLFSIG